jgi:hypothetical protein
VDSGADAKFGVGWILDAGYTGAFEIELPAAGEGCDNMVSTEDVVIKDTFHKIRTALEKH